MAFWNEVKKSISYIHNNNSNDNEIDERNNDETDEYFSIMIEIKIT